MKGTDIALTLIIIIAFISLSLFPILSVGMKKVENNWPTYRCNPAVMPFAGMFGQDATQNFTYCIQSMQSNYMDYLLEPVNYNINVIGNLGGSLSSSINSARAFISNLRGMITSIVQGIFGVFLNILIEIQKMMITLKDMDEKQVAVLATVMYMVDGSTKTMKSVWNGAPGQIVRAIK